MLTIDTTEASEKAREARLRRRLRKEGVVLCKSRERTTHMNNYGGYMLADERNYCLWGENFELSLDDVEGWLKQ